MKRVILILLTAVLFGSVLSASGTKEASSSGAVDPDKPYAGTKLTWWLKSNANVLVAYDNLGKTPWAQYVMEKTGIEIEFIYVDIDSYEDEFGRMVKLKNYPDIIEYEWTKYPGGAVAAINDKVIIDLTDKMEEYAPNLSSLLASNPDIANMVTSSSGQYYCFPFLRGLEQPNITQFSSSFIVRQDVLDELGLERPETIDEWETVLRAFKEYGFEKPFITRNEWMIDVWSPGFDNWGDFYVEDGVVKNGLVEQSRYDVLSRLRSWYSEGLIDNDYLSAQKKSNEEDFTSGRAGACYAPFGQGMGNYTALMHAADSSITEDDIRGTVPVTSKKGQNAKFSKMSQIYDTSGRSAAISTKCRNTEAAMWLLDWMYSEEGNLCCNFGIEGVTYVIDDGVPTYTAVILDNKEYTTATALAIYTRASTSGVCVQDEEYIRQYYVLSNQKEALELSLHTDMAEHFFPSAATVSEENSKEFATIMTDVRTYVREMEAGYISGEFSLTPSSWARYVSQLKDFGIGRAIEIMQEAYDEYMGV